MALPPPPTPEALQALVEKDRQVLAQLAAFTQRSDLSRHYNEHLPHLEQQIDALWPATRPFARKLIKDASARIAWTLKEDDLNDALKDVSFPHWLHFVVNKLYGEAHAVVIDEYWSHYTEAFHEEELAWEDSAAHREALVRLGNAEEVAKHLRRVHVTKREQEWALKPQPLTNLISPYGYGLFLLPQFLGISYMLLLGLALSLIPVAVFLHLRPTREQQDPRRQARATLWFHATVLAWLGSISLLGAVGVNMKMQRLGLSETNYLLSIFAVVSFTGAIAVLLRYRRIAGKLARLKPLGGTPCKH